jgi:hypothetical protein
LYQVVSSLSPVPEEHGMREKNGRKRGKKVESVVRCALYDTDS